MLCSGKIFNLACMFESTKLCRTPNELVKRLFSFFKSCFSSIASCWLPQVCCILAPTPRKYRLLHFINSAFVADSSTLGLCGGRRNKKCLRCLFDGDWPAMLDRGNEKYCFLLTSVVLWRPVIIKLLSMGSGLRPQLCAYRLFKIFKFVHIFQVAIYLYISLLSHTFCKMY